jgi:hypothetical protein
MTAGWSSPRTGSHAGRGFRYQDAVAAELALRGWRRQLPLRRIVPEGEEDISLELTTGWLHVQVKSRREHRGDFDPAGLASVWPKLARRLADDPAARAAVVLERPLAGADAGLDHSLDTPSSPELRDAIARALDGAQVTPADFLSRAHVVVMPPPEPSSLALLAEGLALPEATCAAHLALLRARLGRLADENGVRSAADPASLSVPDLERLLDEVSEAVDPSALEEAVRDGICEIADFATPREDPDFFSGVDVTVGHIVAGLPAERPDEVAMLLRGLAERRVALAVGPSGAGKSALLWMAAYQTRYDVRWYRVRRLARDDVAPLVRLAKGARPAETAPVGFVVDNLGATDRAGYDALVDELREHDRVYVLAACREEDLVLVRTAYESSQVRPVLDEALAERLWRELREDGRTAWDEWREPFEASERLLLEFGHLLSRGTRLRATIAGQVDRRVLEDRSTELAVLAPVALAGTFGARLDVMRLAESTDQSAAAMKVALRRLVDEHLVTDRDGQLGGVHELRSRAISDVIHAVPPPVLRSTVGTVVSLLHATSLQPFLARLLLSGLTDDEVVFDAAAERLASDPDPVALAGVLHALRTVGFRRTAEAWRVVFDEEGVAPTNTFVATSVALGAGDADLLPDNQQRVIERLRAMTPQDPRNAFLDRLGPTARDAIAAAANVNPAAAALAVLPDGASVEPDAARLAALADDASLQETRTLLEAAYGVSPEFASAIADELGGEAALVARLEREHPWIRRAALDEDDGRPTARAEYVHVAASQPDDVNDAVVELTRYLKAFAPSVEIALCRAIDATGETAGYRDMVLADKAISRDADPRRSEVAWNRARQRAAISAVAAASHTEYALAAREVVLRTRTLLPRIAAAYLRGQRPDKRVLRSAHAVVAAAKTLRPPPLSVEAAGPLEPGELPDIEPASFVADMVAGNLLPRLFQGDNVAPLIAQLLPHVERLADPAYWRLLDDPPIGAVHELSRSLEDLFAVTAERGRGDKASAVALRTVAKRGLSAAAGVAHARADQRTDALCGTLEERLAAAGLRASVHRRKVPEEGYFWPSDVFIVLCELDSIFDQDAEPVADMCRPLVEGRPGVVVAPVRGGAVVASFASIIYTDSIIPASDLGEATDLPLPILDETVTNRLREGVLNAAEVSGIVATIDESLHSDEKEALDAAAARSREAHEWICRLADETDHPALAKVANTMSDLLALVEEEIDAHNNDKPIPETLARSIIRGINGEADSVFEHYLIAVCLAIEYDVDPDQAISHLQEPSPPEEGEAA